MSTDSTFSLEDLVQRAARLRERAAALGEFIDPPALERRMAELEELIGAPGFWDDQASAASISAAHASASTRVAQYRELDEEIGSLAEMADLLREEERAGDLDPDMLTELSEGLARADRTMAGLEEARLFSGEHDAGDAVVTINSGEGGTDAQDWTEMLLRMYLRWIEQRGLKADLKEVQAGTEAGIKSVTFTVHGTNAYGLMSAERGVHRLVRLSPFDSANRRQTSFAAVDVAPLVSDAVEIEILDKDLKIDTYRASGAGGQHVNKTDSAVRITHLPTKIVVQCQNERSQTQNRATAMAMLRAKMVQTELERREAEAAKSRGESQSIGFGSQIRSYVVHPYTMVKDLRTGHETGNAQGVLDGDLDGFVRAELERRARGGSGSGAPVDDVGGEE
ncbi:peptide chain release factor 2 [Miltoncostaea oceani]|uniref:peptide chain release factor 2 n=1 Tax=Miltoncostaea oceani TaxID=2843216 RepID=UPI001C3D0FBC|nr:peptide chain release factor 2 [Miltoncostaea oceani]